MTMHANATRPRLRLPEMDAQHEYLYALFDRLIAKADTPGAEMKALLDEIGAYLDFHIVSEEHLMRLYGAPGFSAHQSDHEQAARMFLNYAEEFERGEMNPRTLNNALTGWLSEHCATIDMEYADHVRRIREGGR